MIELFLYLISFVGIALFVGSLMLELELYHKILGLTLIGVFSLAPRALRLIPFTTIASISLFEILFLTLVIVWIISGKYKYVNFHVIPTRRILLIFLLVILVANLRLYLSSADLSHKITNLRIQMFMLSFPLVLSTVDYEKMVKRILVSVTLATIIVSIVTIVVFLFRISIPGLKGTIYEEYGRVIWGGMFIWFPFFLLVIMISINFVTGRFRVYLYMILFIGFIALLLSQTRHLFLVALITVAVLSLRKGFIFIIPKYIYISSLAVIFILLMWTLYTDFVLVGPAQSFAHRLVRLEDEISAADRIVADPVGTWNVGRWGSLMYAIEETESIESMIFGHGSGFTDRNDFAYLHSGWGWTYGSTGLLGVVLLLILVIKTNNAYSKYTKRDRKIDLNSALIQLILSFLIALCIMGPVVGVFLQSYNLFFNALLLGLLEVCRRNITMKKYIYSI